MQPPTHSPWRGASRHGRNLPRPATSAALFGRPDRASPARPATRAPAWTAFVPSFDVRYDAGLANTRDNPVLIGASITMTRGGVFFLVLSAYLSAGFASVSSTGGDSPRRSPAPQAPTTQGQDREIGGLHRPCPRLLLHPKASAATLTLKQPVPTSAPHSITSSAIGSDVNGRQPWSPPVNLGSALHCQTSLAGTMNLLLPCQRPRVNATNY